LIFSNLLGGGRNKDKNKLFFKFFLVDFAQRRARENPKNKILFFCIFGFSPGGGLAKQGIKK
jgi:hypothetical protein